MERPLADSPSRDGRVFVLGGNAQTLAYVTSLRPENRQVTAHLVTLAWTPAGVVLGETRQRANVAADNLAGWLDQTFPPDDERAFVASMRDLELLVRTQWHAEPPLKLDEAALVNPEDVPDEVLDAFETPPQPLVPCAVCRRECVRDHFVWNERQLCAWDYHATVFGRRGPWRGVPYDDRLFETLPKAAYVAPTLLDELHVDPILAASELPEPTLRRLVNVAIEEGGDASYLAVRTGGGLTLLREHRPEAA
ncbi:MAG: hypothetical protein ABI346_09350 [Candidatus Baltobacteraceae bacterium]